MPSLISGYEYDIFISYRRKDNMPSPGRQANDGWVTEFVANLRKELESTFKEDVSIYFDENPHDGLLEMHHVDKSLESKLKCLVFIPIISQTYCDPKSFAWTHEFCAFNRLAREDGFGLDIRLRNGNVASRILPIKVHHLDEDDVSALNGETGSPLRPIEFIYSEPGVNRPLRPGDPAVENISKTQYLNQVNKAANAIKEIISGLKIASRHVADTSFREGTHQVVEGEKRMGRSQMDAHFPDRKSLVVLPFDNISPDKENEYFSDGLTEEIIADLSNVKELSVISRSSAMTFKGSKKKIREIAEEAGVRYVLEGSVRKDSNNLRITAQLIDGVTDEHMWAEKYSGTIEDIFKIQERVSRSIVDALKLKLSKDENARITKKPVQNVQAYELCLKAQYEFYRFREDALLRAIQYLERALGIAGENSFIYGNMALVYCNLYNIASTVNEEYLRKAQVLADKIFAMDPDAPERYVILGFLGVFSGSKKEMVKNFEAAYRANPGHSENLVFLSLGYFYCGQAGRAEKVLNELNEIDPFNPAYHLVMSIVEYSRGNNKLALERIRSAFAKNPEVPQVLLYYAYLLEANNYPAESSAVFDRLVAENPGTIFCPMGTFLKYAFQGEKEKALESLSEESKIKLRKDPEWSWLIADGYAMIHQTDESLEWLEAVVNTDFINYPLLSKYDVFLDNIRREPRFAKLMDRVKFAWEHFDS